MLMRENARGLKENRKLILLTKFAVKFLITLLKLFLIYLTGVRFQQTS